MIAEAAGWRLFSLSVVVGGWVVLVGGDGDGDRESCRELVVGFDGCTERNASQPHLEAVDVDDNQAAANTPPLRRPHSSTVISISTRACGRPALPSLTPVLLQPSESLRISAYRPGSRKPSGTTSTTIATMATVAARNLPWLSAPSSGHAIFAEPAPNSSPAASPDEVDAFPTRLIALRGTELFVARGSEVRLADVRHLKGQHPKFNVLAEEAVKYGLHSHKVLDLPKVDFEIKGIEISEDGLFMAIVGEREVGVAVLPGEGGGALKQAGEVKGKKNLLRVPR